MKEQIRLLVDCHCFDYGEAQGINTYIRELYSALISLAPKITFIFAAQNILRIKSIFGEQDNIQYVQLGKHNRYYRLLVEYPNIIKKYKIDWAHFQYTTPLIKNCKTIVTLHDILFEDYPQYFPLSYRISKHILFKYSAKRADLLLTVSDYSKQRISQRYNIWEDSIHITYNGVNQKYSQIDKSKALKNINNKYNFDKYILYVSRFEPRKNQQALLKAYIDLQLHKLGYELVFIGVKSLNCWEFDKIFQIVAPDIKAHIHVLSNIDKYELSEWYAASSLFVYPSYAEGFGIPPLEAGASMVPVICNNQTAMADFVFFGRYHIDTGNQSKLNNSILEILSNIPDKEELRDIQNKILKRYDWNVIAKNFYHSLKSKSLL